MTSAVRWLLGGAFALAALLKLADPTSFAVSIARLGVAPASGVPTSAILLPGVELAAALALLFLPSFRAAACAVILALLLAFTAALSVALLRGDAVPCGCFGDWGGVLNHPAVALARNVALGALAVVAFIQASSAPAPRSAETPRP